MTLSCFSRAMGKKELLVGRFDLGHAVAVGMDGWKESIRSHLLMKSDTTCKCGTRARPLGLDLWVPEVEAEDSGSLQLHPSPTLPNTLTINSLQIGSQWMFLVLQRLPRPAALRVLTTV